MDRIALLGRRTFVFLGLAVIILLVMDFNNRMADLARLSAQFERESQMIAAMRSTERYLEIQISYAGSDAAVEDAVREDGRLIREGDYAVIPLTPVGFEPDTLDVASLPAEPLTYWQIWMALFFGQNP